MTPLTGLDFWLAVAFMVAFWAAVAWLFVSKTGRKVFRFFVYLFSISCTAFSLWYLWEPYLGMLSITVGFIAGLAYSDWYHGYSFRERSRYSCIAGSRRIADVAAPVRPGPGSA